VGRREIRITGDDWRPATDIQNDEMATKRLAAVYEFAWDDALLELFANVRERATREHAYEWDRSNFQRARKASAKQLKSIVIQARSVQNELAKLVRLLSAFEEEYEFEPNLMQQIAHVGPGSNLYVADELQCLGTLLKRADSSSEIGVALKWISSLHVRIRHERARIRNSPLQNCVADCRTYWTARGRTWKPDALEDKIVRNENEPSCLTGDCERFAWDLLRLAGIEPTLSDLYTALTRKRRKGKIAGKSSRNET